MDSLVGTNLKPATKALEAFIKSLDYGDQITFKKLKEVAGLDIQNVKYRHILETAKRNLLKHHARVLISLRGIGYEIGTPNSIIAESSSYRKRSFNSAKKAYQIVKTIDLNKLSETERTKAINEQCKSGLLLVSYRASENKLICDEKEGLKLREPTETSIVKILLNKAEAATESV